MQNTNGMEHPFGYNEDETIGKSKLTRTKHNEGIREAHTCGEFSQAELDLLDYWLLRGSTGFKHSLFKTMALADPVNLERLWEGFPDEVVAFETWRNGDLTDRFRNLGIEV